MAKNIKIVAFIATIIILAGTFLFVGCKKDDLVNQNTTEKKVEKGRKCNADAVADVIDVIDITYQYQTYEITDVIELAKNISQAHDNGIEQFLQNYNLETATIDDCIHFAEEIALQLNDEQVEYNCITEDFFHIVTQCNSIEDIVSFVSDNAAGINLQHVVSICEQIENEAVNFIIESNSKDEYYEKLETFVIPNLNGNNVIEDLSILSFAYVYSGSFFTWVDHLDYIEIEEEKPIFTSTSTGGFWSKVKEVAQKTWEVVKPYAKADAIGAAFSVGFHAPEIITTIAVNPAAGATVAGGIALEGAVVSSTAYAITK